MSKRHTITQGELDEWLRQPQWLAFARSFSGKSHKSLEVDGTSLGGLVFRVTDHGETRFLGADKAAAIAAYNEAP